jgi:hypothetical protein
MSRSRAWRRMEVKEEIISEGGKEAKAGRVNLSEVDSGDE